MYSYSYDELVSTSLFLVPFLSKCSSNLPGCLDPCWPLPLASCSGARRRIALALVSIGLCCGQSGYSCSFPISAPKSRADIFPSSVGYTVFVRSLAIVVSYYFAQRFGSLFCIVDRVLLALYATLFFLLPIGHSKGRRCRHYFLLSPASCRFFFNNTFPPARI